MTFIFTIERGAEILEIMKHIIQGTKGRIHSGSLTVTCKSLRKTVGAGYHALAKIKMHQKNCLDKAHLLSEGTSEGNKLWELFLRM